MKKYILALLAFTVLFWGGCSTGRKYKVNVYRGNLPAPDKSGSLVYGYVISNYPLKEVIIIKKDDGRRFRADLIPSTIHLNSEINFFYISNVPKGVYAIHQIVSSTQHVGYRYTRYKGQVFTCEVGTKYNFSVDNNSSFYIGRIALLVPRARKKIKRIFPQSYLSLEDSEEGKVLFVLIKENDSDFRFRHSIVVKHLQKYDSGKLWVKRIRKNFPDFEDVFQKGQKKIILEKKRKKEKAQKLFEIAKKRLEMLKKPILIGKYKNLQIVGYKMLSNIFYQMKSISLKEREIKKITHFYVEKGGDKQVGASKIVSFIRKGLSDGMAVAIVKNKNVKCIIAFSRMQFFKKYKLNFKIYSKNNHYTFQFPLNGRLIGKCKFIISVPAYPLKITLPNSN